MKKPNNQLTSKEKEDCHRGYCFNACHNNAIEMDRYQGDYRHRRCEDYHSEDNLKALRKRLKKAVKQTYAPIYDPEKY